MTEILESYVQGAWWKPESDEGAAVVRDASTGEVVTAVSTTGLDLAGALDYARTVGQASLGRLTFHQRALLLKEFAQLLTARKDELYALSSRTGATKNDSMVDIDARLAALVKEAIDEGSLRTDVPPALVSRLLFGMVNSLVEWHRAGGGVDGGQLSEAITTIVFDGLAMDRPHQS
jgi:acyl-CoA reductase-like NAD-dependent aldehyde dehydrogenase